MRIWALLILSLIIFQQTASADVTVYSENNKFGLKDGNNIITVAKYKKLIILGEKSWIVQDGSKFGIIDNNGNILVETKYNRAERVLGKYVKFRKGDKYGVFDQNSQEILPVEYSSIDLLYGGLFVTCKNYLYGISDLEGNVILENIFDDIYMPDFNTLVLVYNQRILEIKREKGKSMDTPLDIQKIKENIAAMNSDTTENPLTATGYYGVTFTDYILKLFSSISPSYEETIDELMFSQGADSVSVLMKFSWLPKFPFVYAKRYYKNVIAPFNGPLSKTKKNLRKHIKE